MSALSRVSSVWFHWASLGALLALPACAQIIGANDYKAGTSSSTGSSCQGAMDCYSCAPTNRDQFLNACTDATCSPFDKSRVTKLNADGSRPAVVAEGTGGAPSTSATTAATTSSTSSTTDGAGGGSTTSGTGGGTGNPKCSEVGTNVVYATGSTASEPFLSVVAQFLASHNDMTVVYVGSGSCAGVDAVLNGTRIKGTGNFWDPMQPNVTLGEKTCDLPAAGVVTDIGISDVFASTCSSLPQGLPNGVTDEFGPVQTMTLVTASSSTEKSISADAAYFVYGFGKDSGIAPWNDESLIFQRTPTSGTQNLVAAAIGVPANEFRGVSNSSSDSLLNALLAASQTADGSKSIGIVSSDLADTNRSKLRVLAFQDVGQTCGYYPDSTATALDKSNVRDGHYPIWGPLHLLTRNPSADAQRLVNYLGGVTPLDGLNLVQVYVDAKVVPLCAMHVTRTSDGGPLQSFAPANPCSCLFEAQASGATSCKACTVSSDCPTTAPNCSFGYCEQ